MESSAMTGIPSDEDFARAKRLARERASGLDSVCERVIERFGESAPLHRVYILPQRDVDYRAYIFFREDKDVETCTRTGVAKEIQDFTCAELARVARGGRDEISVAFEFDSDENVARNFEGDYLLRLR
jgi:hypothetical protein